MAHAEKAPPKTERKRAMSTSIQPMRVHEARELIAETQRATAELPQWDDVEPEIELKCACTRCQLAVMWERMRYAVKEARARLRF